MMERCAPLESSRKRRRKERKKKKEMMKKLHYERLPVWARQSYTGAHLIVRPLGQRCCCWWWRATVRTLPSLSLSHLPDRYMRADPFTCVIFPPRSYFFFVVVCYGRAWKSSTMIEPTLQGWSLSEGISCLVWEKCLIGCRFVSGDIGYTPLFLSLFTLKRRVT